MSKITSLLISAATLVLIQCKPAAEDRVIMHEKANRISDSIGRVIDAAMEEVKIEPQPGTVVDTTKK
jgi:hypothetical protein